MKLPVLAAIVVLTSTLVAGVSVDAPASHPVPDVAAFLSSVDETVLYEGLPHRLFEKSAFEAEKEKQGVFTVSDEFFYGAPLPLTEEDAFALSQTFRLYEVCVPYTGPKLCGGFHADYLITWLKKKVTLASVLICFGCGEARAIIGDATYQVDLSGDGYKALSEILRKYRQNRPKSALGPPPKLEPIKVPPPKFDPKL